VTRSNVLDFEHCDDTCAHCPSAGNDLGAHCQRVSTSARDTVQANYSQFWRIFHSPEMQSLLGGVAGLWETHTIRDRFFPGVNETISWPGCIIQVQGPISELLSAFFTISAEIMKIFARSQPHVVFICLGSLRLRASHCHSW
jgi:hypothetical protein